MPQVRYVEDIYYDYLHDCYQANKRLTNDDWMWYGRELHHIEVPDCEGGAHHPLNSQYLTTYQHWVAGVLQSEVLGRVCFAFVPKNVLPEWIETLRVKWLTTKCQRMTKVRLALPRGRKYTRRKPLTPKAPKPRKERKPRTLKNPEERADKIPYAERKPNDRSRNVSKKLGAPIILTTPQGQVIRYDSIKLACRIHSLHPGHLREVAQGKRKQHKGYTAQYLPK